MSVTNPLKNGAEYGEYIDKKDNNTKKIGWHKVDINDEDEFDKFVEKTLNSQRKSYSNLMFYGCGLWVTAYARRNVYMTLLKIDSDVCYCDTDSIKYVGKHDDIFEAYNKQVYDKYREVIKHFRGEFTIDDFTPKDREGVKHPIGVFEFDGFYSEAKFLGAKKYCFREDGDLHITVAGVSKKGVTALNDDINNFKKHFVFDYHQSGKLTHVYLNNQSHFDFKDYNGEWQHSSQVHGVVLQPTTYTLGITPDYEALIKDYQDMEARK